MDAIHTNVLPLDRERALIANLVEGHYDLLEIDVAATHRTEVPLAAGVAKGRVTAEDADRTVAVTPPGIFDVSMKNTRTEFPDERDIVHPLVAEVRGIVVEAEAAVVFHRGKGALGGGNIECDLGGMNLEGKIDIRFIERIEDRGPAFREVGEAGVPVFLRGRRKRVDRMPDRGTGESVDGNTVRGFREARLGIEKRAGGLCGERHLFSGAAADAFRFAIAPDIGREDGFVAGIDRITDGLADEVARDREAGEAVVGEEFPFFADVGFRRGGLVDIEVVAPAGEFDPVVAHFFDKRGEICEWQVGPLAGE